MGKKNRKKTTWRRLTLNGDDGAAGAVHDRDPAGKSPSKRGPNGSDHPQRHGSQTSTASSSSSSSGRPPFLRHARGHPGRPFLVQAPIDAIYSNAADQSPTPFLSAAQDEEYPENGDGWWSTEPLGQFQPYLYAVPPPPSLIFPPPYHPLQWYEDPRLPADCQYYFCLTQPFPAAPQQPATAVASSAPSSPEGSETGSEQDQQTSATSEDGSSACPADEYGAQPPPPVTVPLPPPPYIYPGAFMFKPYAYNANNSYFWWNDNGLYFGRGGKRRRRRFIGGEGITYDRWPSRKDRLADLKSKPFATQTATAKGASPTATMNNETLNSKDSLETTISNSSADGSFFRDGIQPIESLKMPQDVSPTMELPDILSDARGPSEERSTNPGNSLPNSPDASHPLTDCPVASEVMVTSGDAVREIPKESHDVDKPFVERSLSADAVEMGGRGIHQDHPDGVTDQQPRSSPETETVQPRSSPDKLTGILPGREQCKNAEPASCTESIQSWSKVDSDVSSAIAVPSSSSPEVDSQTRSSTSSSFKEVVTKMGISPPSGSVAAIIEVPQPQSKGTEVGSSRSPTVTPSVAMPGSGTSTPTAHRLHYKQLEDPVKCSKYYQLCSEDDVAEYEPPPSSFVDGKNTSGSEIVVHEADSASECGSEDVEMIGHRYETAAEKKYKNNTLSLAAELLSTNQQLPYDDDFKPMAEEGPTGAYCYTNTQILESYYGQISRKSRDRQRREGTLLGREVADSGIHTDESADEGEHRNRNSVTEDEEILFSRNRGTNAFQYQPFGRRPRSEYSPLIYLRSKGPWHGCCCNIM